MINGRVSSYNFQISLRIRGGLYGGKKSSDALFSSREVSEALGLIPQVVRAADRQKMVSVELNEPAAYWSHRFSFDAELELDEAIAIVADKVYKNANVFHNLSKTGAQIELFIGLTFKRSSGHEIAWKVLEKLAESKVGISLDLYNETDDKKQTDGVE